MNVARRACGGPELAWVEGRGRPCAEPAGAVFTPGHRAIDDLAHHAAFGAALGAPRRENIWLRRQNAAVTDALGVAAAACEAP